MFKWLHDLITLNENNPNVSTNIDIDPITTEGHIFNLDMQSAIQAHLNWKVRFRDYIHGINNEELEVPTISSDCHCALGKWLYAEGKRKFGHLPEYEDLLIKHANFHLNAGQVLQMMKDRNHIGAQRQLNDSYFDCSQEVITALETLEEAFKQSKLFKLNG